MKLAKARHGDASAEYERLADEELMPLVTDADPRAFAVIVDRHGAAAFALAYRICGAKALAEDVTQEALLSLWRSASTYDPSLSSVRTWTLRILRNQAIDTLRASSRRPPQAERRDETELPEFEAPQRTDSEALARVEGEAVRDALELLPDAQRQAIELAYFGGFSQSEIAGMLEQPLGTIKGRMRLGLHALRDLTLITGAAA